MGACMDVIPTSRINPCLPILAINLYHISLTPFTSTFSFPQIKSCGEQQIRNARPVLGTVQGLQFHPGMGLLHLNPAFVLGAPVGTSPQSLNQPLVLTTGSTPAPHKSTSPKARGGKPGQGWSRIHQSCRQCDFIPSFPLSRGATLQACQ